MKNWSCAIASIAVAALVLTTACSSGQTAKMAKNQDLMAGVTAASWKTAPETPDPAFLLSANHFASRLFCESARNSGNLMISPPSVYLALAMTLNGADGTTREAMLKALADQGLDAGEVNRACRNWAATLSKPVGSTTLKIANSIWASLLFEPDQAFLQMNADFYGAGARKLDFFDANAANVINAWVREATSEKIEKIIDKTQGEELLYLVNAIYFKAKWQEPFDEMTSRVSDQAFTTPSGAVTAAFMTSTRSVGYFSGDGASGAVLPYDDGRLAYFALLPDDGVSPRDWLAQQDPSMLLDRLSELTGSCSQTAVTLSLPKYAVQYKNELKDELTAMGMGIAFAPDLADFSLLSENRDNGLYISGVGHTTFISVDEEGTEAAAVTGVTVAGCSISTEIELRLDRPFLYGVIDLESGMPLFLGILDDPAVKS